MDVKITMATLIAVFLVTVHAGRIPTSGLCGYFCSGNYSPVCGELPNGKLKLFPNKCELRRAVCRGRAEYTDETDCGLQLQDLQDFPDLSVSA